MASFRKNLHHNIQVGIDARVDAMNEYHHSKQKLRSGLLQSAKKDNSFTISREGQVAKSTYVRLIAPGTQATHVIYGGFNIDDIKVTGKSEGNKDFFKSLKDRVQGPESAYYETSPITELASLKGARPKAGITNVNVLFQGYGGAVRKATITWACSSLQQLAKYQNGSFLSPGQTLILDWGWVRSDPNSGAKFIPKFLIEEDNGSITLNSDLFTTIKEDKDGEEYVKYSPVWDQLEIQQYGDWSGIIGPVTKFTWSQRDDGGFDCITEMMSRGSNIFEKQLPTVQADKNEVLNTFPIASVSHEQFVKAVVKDSLESEEIDGWLTPARPLLNIVERIDGLDYEILGKYFGEYIGDAGKWKAKLNLDDNQNYEVVKSTDANVFAILRKKGADDEDSPDLFEEDEDEDDDNTKIYKRARDFSGEIWVRWGWFEDNIVSYYARDYNKIGKDTSRITEFRSLSHVDKSEESTKDCVSVAITNNKRFHTYDPSVFIMADKFNPSWFYANPDENIDSSYKELAKMMGDCRYKFSIGDINTSTQGRLRNLYVNLSVVKKVFSKSGASIQSSMLALAKSLNSGINIWDFELGSEESLTDAQRTFFIKEKGDDIAEKDGGQCDICNKVESQKPSKSYVFDNYGENSLVHDISLTAAVPDKFAITAGLGATSGKDDATDAIKKFFKDDVDSTNEQLAKKIGEFYTNPDNIDVFRPYPAPVSDIQFGNWADGINRIPNLRSDGLRDTEGKSQWNHMIHDHMLDTTPSKRVSGREYFQKKYEAARKKITADANRALRTGETFNVSDLWPYPVDPESAEGQEAKAPYSLADGKLKSQFVSVINWLLVECPTTRVKTQRKDIIMPINIDMTLEGMGGIYPGNMFRLSYLPETYGQVNFTDTGSPSDEPITYFSVMGVTQTINQEGWQTKITANTNKHTKEIETGVKGVSMKDILASYDEYMNAWVNGEV